MNENKEKMLQQMKGITLALAIYFTLSTIVYVFAIIGVAIIKTINFSELGLGADEIEMMTQSITTFDTFVISLNLVSAFIVCVIMYRFKSKLKKGQLVSKFPYIGVIVLQVLNLGLQLISGEFSLTSLIINGGIAVLAGLVISKLGKIATQFDSEELPFEL